MVDAFLAERPGAAGRSVRAGPLAERAAPELAGDPVAPWESIANAVIYVLGQNRNLQTTRKPEVLAVTVLARKVTDHLRCCGYTALARISPRDR